MLVVVPPSETKVSGGRDDQVLDVSALSFPLQNPTRLSLLEQVEKLSLDPKKALAALKLGPKGHSEIERNQQIRFSGVMPALERYSGVLYDALDSATLGPGAAWAAKHLAIFSALFGLILSTDLIPAYRLSYDSRLSRGTPTTQWADVSDILWSEVRGFVVDLRSEGYRRLAVVPETRGVFVNLVQPGPVGQRKALGHANKSVKGQLVRAMARDGVQLDSVDDLIAWGAVASWNFDQESLTDGRIDLVISGS
jgi:hypothetical protein